MYAVGLSLRGAYGSATTAVGACAHKVWIKSGIAFQILTHLFFRTVAFFFPVFAERAEKFFCHAQVVWTRIQASWREDDLQAKINELEQKTQDVARLNEVQKAQLELLQRAMTNSQQGSQILLDDHGRIGKKLIEEIASKEQHLLLINQFQRFHGSLKTSLKQLSSDCTQLRAQSERLARENLKLTEELVAERAKNQELQDSFRIAASEKLLNSSLEKLESALKEYGSIEQTEVQTEFLKLMAQLKDHGNKWLGLIEKRIGILSQEDPSLVALRGLKDISQRAVEGWEKTVLVALLVLRSREGS